jgi:branched-chain amino acid transport system ATP-binding protein
MTDTTPAAALLETRDLAVRYGPIQAVRGVSLSLRQGQILALIGPNGAGKSSLARSLAGLVPTCGGQILLGGEDITSLGSDRRVGSGIFLVPEGRGVFTSLTVEENLRLGGYRRRACRLPLAAIYDQFPTLHRMRRRKAGMLSGGEQQLLAIARALTGRPTLLILDEPSMGLAPKMVETLVATLQGAELKDMTILLLEQNASLAMAMAKDVYGISRGQVTALRTDGSEVDESAIIQKYLN